MESIGENEENWGDLERRNLVKGLSYLSFKFLCLFFFVRMSIERSAFFSFFPRFF